MGHPAQGIRDQGTGISVLLPGYGLEVDGDGWGSGVFGLFACFFGFSLGFLGLVLGPLLFEDLREGLLVPVPFGEVLGDCDKALFRVFFDLFDGGGGVGLLFLARQVATGDLEAVEEQAGALGV